MTEIPRARCAVFRELKKKFGIRSIIRKLEVSFEGIIDDDKKVLELTRRNQYYTFPATGSW